MSIAGFIIPALIALGLGGLFIIACLLVRAWEDGQ